MQKKNQSNIIDKLVCPSCKSANWSKEAEISSCLSCGTTMKVNSCISFPSLLSKFEVHLRQDDLLGNIKEKIKKSFYRIYPKLIFLISPVYWLGLPDEFISKFNWEKDIVLDLGSGCARHHPNILNIDISAYPTVDIVCPIETLPFANASVDGIVSVAVLEHVKEPRKIALEILRVLKPGGELYCYIPFIQGIHASPDDFQRYTPHGLEQLFFEFTDKNVTISAGPTSGFIWILQEWLALTLSFGSKRLYWILYYFFFLLTPLKFLDYFLNRHPMAKNIASGFAIRAKKKATI